MKKYLFSFVALTTILAGCGKEIDLQFEKVEPNTPTITTTLRASVPETKVSTDNAGYFNWQAGDKVTVLNTSGTAYEFSTASGGTSVDFSSSAFTGTLGTEAFYPASANHESGKFNLEPSFTWSADASMMPMLGVVNTSDNTAVFSSVGGIVKLICYNVPADARKLVVTSATKKLTGLFTPSGSPKEIATADKGDGDNVVTVNFAAGHATDMVFYLPMPTGSVGVLTFEVKDDSDEVLFTKTTAGAPTIVRNNMIVAPALNCSPALWSEDWSDYSAGDVPSGKTDRKGYGNATLTYSQTNGTGTSAGTTQIYTGTMYAGGTSPELLIGKKGSGESVAGGTFTVAGIPTNGAASMFLSFKHYKTVEISLSTGVTAAKTSFTSDGSETVLLTNTGSVSTFDLTFTASTTNNVRLDDIVVVKSYNTPQINVSATSMTIGVGYLSNNSITVNLANGVDDLGINTVLSGADYSWVESAVISEGKLVVTAKAANAAADDLTATVSLKATGAEAKSITVTQKTALVSKPSTISAVPGNGTFTASWAKDTHATGYLAYLCDSDDEADPETNGTALTPSLDGSTYSVTQSGLTNGTNYYLYVKVNGVAENYVADTQWAVSDAITPNSGTLFYEKITAVGSLVSGDKYLIVYEDGPVAFNGGIASDSYDVTSNNISVTIADSKIVSNSTTNAASFVISGTTGSYTIKSAAGYYIGRTSSSSSTGIDASTSTSCTHAITFSDGNAVISDSGSGSAMYLRYNSAADQCRFRYYSKSTSVQAVQLYKLNDPRSAAGIAWKKSGVAADSDSATMLTGDDTMPTITLDNPNSLSVTYSSTATDVATINASTGALTLVGEGSTTISASFADGDATYKPATVSYTLTVTDSRTVCATPTFSPAAGSVSADTDVTISSATTGATIYYTIDGTTPTTSSSHGTVGTPSATVTIDVAKTVKAIAVKDDYRASSVASASYTISGVATPLSAPDDVTITTMNASSFTATWKAADNASSYAWILSDSSTAPASTSDSSVKAYGTSASDCTQSGTTWTLTKTGLNLSGKYYLYVKAVGDGVSYTDSGYSSKSAILIILDCSSNIFSLSTSGNDASSEISKTVGDYTYKLYAKDACYYYGSKALLIGTTGSYITFPAISGYKLCSVSASNCKGASAKGTVSVCPTSSTTAVTGGTASTIAAEGSKTWTLTGTSVNTAYRLYIGNAYNLQYTNITLIYFE